MGSLHTSDEAIDPLVCYNEGNEKYAHKDYEGAVVSYMRALQVAPRFLDATVNLGNAYTALHRYAEALAVYDNACVLGAQQVGAQAVVHYNRGNALEGQGHLSQALAAYSHAIEFDPHFVWAYGNRGHVLSRLHRHEEAVQDYDRAFELGPHDINTAWTFVWAHMKFATPAHTEEAARELLRVARIDPQHAISLLCQGVAALLQMRIHDALTWFEQAEKQEPGEYEIECDLPFWRGMVLAFQGENEQAQEEIDQALHLGLPPVLLHPLRWVRAVNPSFTRYVVDLFRRYSVPNDL